jgi:hypothetical protein
MKCAFNVIRQAKQGVITLCNLKKETSFAVGSIPPLSTNFKMMDLTNEQKQKAVEWYMKHSNHVLNLFESAERAYPPSVEDVNFPNLWKPEHWAWYMVTYVFHEEANK